MNHTSSVLVYGDTFIATLLTQKLLSAGHSVVWAAGSGVRLNPIHNAVLSEKALSVIVGAYQSLSGEANAVSVEQGLFHRVFRNKSFQIPLFKRATTLDDQVEAFKELVWGPEQTVIGAREFRVADQNLMGLEADIRLSLERHPNLVRILPSPIIELDVGAEGGRLQLGNGSRHDFSKLYFCDSLTELHSIAKLASVLKHQVGGVRPSAMMSALQVMFHHHESFPQVTDLGLVVPLKRESGEKFDRDAIGYFVDAQTSAWTLFLQPSEIEDNHEIMKKLRKLKQALNHAFSEPEMLPAGRKDFSTTIAKESVHFQPAMVMDPTVSSAKMRISAPNADFILMPEFAGITVALERIADLFSADRYSLDDMQSDAVGITKVSDTFL